MTIRPYTTERNMKTLPPDYKRGKYGFIFRWNGFEYVRANLDPEYRHIAANKDGEVKTGRKREPIIDGKKRCTSKNGCGEIKPVSEFYEHKGYLSSLCKTCDIKRSSKIKRAERNG